MAIKFEFDLALELRARDIIKTLKMDHIKPERLACIRSRSSGAKQTIARCYGLSKIWQKVLNTKAWYIIEMISEKFDKLSEEDQDKTIIHELLHIPNSFGGGFRHHSNWVTESRINELYKKYIIEKTKEDL